jgi:hypothetical protein
MQNFGSTLQSMGRFGMLQSGCIPDECLDTLRHCCLNTPPDSCAFAEGIFPPEVMRLLQQAHHSPSRLELIKLPDGFALVTSPDHKLLSIIKDDHLCSPLSLVGHENDTSFSSNNEEEYPKSVQRHEQEIIKNKTMMRVRVTKMNPPAAGSKCVFFSVAQNPQSPQIKPFYMVHHDGVVKTNQISRFGSVNSAISRFAEKIPFQMQPRVYNSATNMGTVTGRTIEGLDADFVKSVLLAALGNPHTNNISQKKVCNSNIYDTPLQISDTLSKLLLLREPKKPIWCARLRDGLIGYRNRKDDQQSLVFVAHSKDFNAASPVSNSPIHLTKITYTNDSVKSPRVWVNGRPESSSSPHIVPGNNTTVQDVQAIIEHSFRCSSLASAGCGNFPLLCFKEAKRHLRNDYDCRNLDTAHTRGCERLLASAHLNHQIHYEDNGFISDRNNYNAFEPSDDDDGNSIFSNVPYMQAMVRNRTLLKGG